MTRKSNFFASVGALSAARAAAMASQILVLPILARYLTPVEFGLAALAMSVAIFANMLSDGGMGRSLIRTPLEKRDEWSSVFWFLVALGVSLSVLILALTPLMVWLFAEPALFWPLAALAGMPFILSMNAPFAAEMEQREVFSELALAQTVATVVALGIAVYMAVVGFGVWALIVQQIVLNAIVALWSIIRARFRPMFHFSRSALGNHFGFGRDTAVVSLIGYLREQSTPLVIGKVLGTADLGIFAMAMRFLRLPMFALAGPASRVVYVRLTQTQDDLEVFRAIMLAATRLLAFAVLPSMAAVAMVSETLFLLLLTERWVSIAPIFAFAVGGAAINAVTMPALSALTSLGLTGKRLRLTIEITTMWLVLLVATVFVGLVAVALARTVWMVVMLPRHWAYLKPACGVTARAYLGAFYPGAATAIATMIALFAISAIGGLQGWTLIGVGVAVWALMCLLACLVFKAQIRSDLAKLRG